MFLASSVDKTIEMAATTTSAAAMTERIQMTMPKRAADFIALGVKCWKAALLVLEPYASAQPPGNARKILLNQVRILQHMVEHADRTVITGVEAPPVKPQYRGLDRRGRGRPAQPACPVCSAPPDQMRVTIRTPHIVYFKCKRCGEVTTVDMPKQKRR
jgi:hypothetical protein